MDKNHPLYIEFLVDLSKPTDDEFVDEDERIPY